MLKEKIIIEYILKYKLLKLLKKILLIAIRIYYCVTLCYLVYKHSYLLTYYSLIYIRIISRDRLLGFNSIKDYKIFNNSYNNSNSNSNAKI
ncbi:hypothetical protein HBH90_112980 [Parastagonospora nodorum]|nr:hypothetical protein HBH90_112980 [Parastagonospora nodorum]KAH4514948.1 hypothetical protein HBH87_128530 [Parastagonospora nodorum]KAH6249965.1 hypothetical protein HBI42_162130 [Parastagonospora nodorum]